MIFIFRRQKWIIAASVLALFLVVGALAIVDVKSAAAALGAQPENNPDASAQQQNSSPIFGGINLNFITGGSGEGVSGSIVPCGNPGQDPCNVCYIGKLAENIMRFLIWDVAAPISVIMFIYAGFLFMFAWGGERITKARKVLLRTIIGLLIIFGAFFFVDILIKELVGANTNGFLHTVGPWNNPFADKNFCDKFNLAPSGSVPSATTIPPSAPSTGLSALEARQKLQDAQIPINKNKGECPDGVPYQAVTGGCTSLKDIKPYAINEAIVLKNSSNCPVVVSGGTELGHSDTGITHASGQKLDVLGNSCLDSYLQKRFNCSTTCQAPNGTKFVRESDHWDITFSPT